MGLCSTPHHSQVPQTTNGVFIAYCWQCQAFTVTMWRNTQYDDGEPVEDLYKEMHLGPFDGAPEALRVATVYMSELLDGSGLPWDRSSWYPPA